MVREEINLKIDVRINAKCSEPQVTVENFEINDEVSEIVKKLSEPSIHMIAGFANETVCLLDQSEIYRIYAEAGKVMAETEKDKYCLRLRLYELEERLDSKMFVRISNSEIVNFLKVKEFDLNFAGTIQVKLKNSSVSFVSRRYMNKIKKTIGI